MAIASEAASGGGSAPAERNAIVFIPGMGDDFVDQSIQSIGARLAHALNRSATSAAARFPLDFDVRQSPLGAGLAVSACTISRDDGGRAVPCLDVYKLDSVRTLRARYDGWGLVWRMLVPAAFLLLYLRGVLSAATGRAGKTRRERYQLLFAIFVMLLLTAYVVVLALAAVKTAFPHALDRLPARVTQGLVVVLTTLGLWKSRAVQSLGHAAGGFTCVIGYLGFGDRRDQLLGQLHDVLDGIQEQPDVRYRRIDVVAYSFGTIVALDAFFPSGRAPNIRLRDVNTLVLIGSPYDFVRTYWRDYFDRRSLEDGVPRSWLNFYAPIDILASNFRHDGEIGEPEQGVPTDAPRPRQRRPTSIAYGGSRSANDVGALEFLTFLGLRAHSLYWGRTDEREETVFSQIVSTLYAGEPILR